MPRVITNPYADYPPGWSTFDSHVAALGTRILGFSGSPAEVNRFAARYRAARCFRDVTFEGLSSGTASGYSALCQLLLTFSAFEYFLKSIGITLPKSQQLLSDPERDRILKHVRTLNGHREVFAFVRTHVNQNHQAELGRFLRAQGCNPVYLASSIRHLFAHGLLTPNAADVPPSAIASVSRYLCRVLLHIMDREFSRRIEQFEKMLGHEP